MARPVFFNLVQIQMPVGALTSITHRVTGIVLVLGIPYGVYLLDLSLQAAIVRTANGTLSPVAFQGRGRRVHLGVGIPSVGRHSASFE